MSKEKVDMRQLIARFMDGVSTIDEERQMAEYFRTHEVDAELQPYKQMFALFDSGNVELTTKPLHSRRRRMWYTLAGMAAGIIIALFIFMPNQQIVPESALTATADSIMPTPADEHTEEEGTPSDNKPQSTPPETEPTLRRYQPKVERPLLAQSVSNVHEAEADGDEEDDDIDIGTPHDTEYATEEVPQPAKPLTAEQEIEMQIQHYIQQLHALQAELAVMDEE